MRPADLRRLLLLAALWGGSFLFIRVAVHELGPVVTAAVRVFVAGLALVLYASLTRHRLDLRARWPQYLLLGVIGAAVPFALIAASELRLPASMAAILNATTPLFGALVGALWLGEPLRAGKAAGIALALVGVGITVGWGPLALDTATVVAVGASLLAALCYALAGAYTKARLTGAPPLGMAVGSLGAASLILLPAAPFAWPVAAAPSAAVLWCVLAIALFSTAIAYILYFRLVVDVGPTRALTVTFLTPVFGLLWGALFLDETVNTGKLIGCAIVLVGTALVTETGPRSLGFGAEAET